MLTKVEKKVSQVMPSIDNLSLNTMNELYKDSILQNKVHTTRRGDKEIWLVRFKGQMPTKPKWYDKAKVGELFTHLLHT